MKIAKKLIAISTTVSLLGSALMPLAVADNTSGNSITGYDSTNISKVTNENSVMVSNVSDTKITNIVHTTASTGGNSASYNTLGGSVLSGNATNTVGIANTGNVNTTVVKLGTSGDNSSGNAITGALSKNISKVTNRNEVDVYNDNTAWVTNHVDASSKTGANDANYNTGPGSVMSGNASTSVGVVNRLNDSATSVTLGQGGAGGNKASNSTTGYDSTNVAKIYNLNDVMVSNVSDARVLNFVKAGSYTGRNSSSYNTLGGSVSSGNAATGVGLDTTANINTNAIAVAMGGFANEAGSSITGANSVNIAKTKNTNTFDVFNYNNKGLSKDAPDYCKEGNAILEEGANFDSGSFMYPRECWGVYNFDFDSAKTGMNNADYNTGLGQLLSGIAAIQKTVKVWLNDSFTAIEP